jgi:DNA-binding MarR family transcriptional regulator
LLSQILLQRRNIVKSEKLHRGIEKTDMALSLKQVRYFIATADAGQVSQAAMELNVSQSAVTAAIKQLEDGAGVQLFTRLPTGVSLTAEGARFLQHARNIMAAVNAAQNAPLTEDSAISGTVRIGVSSCRATTRASPAVIRGSRRSFTSCRATPSKAASRMVRSTSPSCWSPTCRTRSGWPMKP